MSSAYITYTGPHINDLSSMTGKLVDMEDGGRRGLRPDLEGFSLVVLELQQSYPTKGVSAGIPQDVYDHFLMCNETVTIIQEKLAISRKQTEVLEESLAFYIDARQNDIALMADAMKSRAQRRKDESILTPFEQTLAYNAQIGDKAAKTRKKKAAEAKEQGAEAEAKAKADAALQEQLNAYKAELAAKFNEAVAQAVEKKLAGLKEPDVA